MDADWAIRGKARVGEEKRRVRGSLLYGTGAFVADAVEGEGGLHQSMIHMAAVTVPHWLSKVCRKAESIRLASGRVLQEVRIKG